MTDWTAQVAFATPVPGPFDYLAGEFRPQVGARVLVEFGRRECVGYVVGIGPLDPDNTRELKPLIALLDERPWFTEELWQSLNFVARYYHRGQGEVLSMALPAALRRVRLPGTRAPLGWRRLIADGGADGGADSGADSSQARTELQTELLEMLSEQWTAQAELIAQLPKAATALRQLERRELVERCELPTGVRGKAASLPTLETEQAAAVASIKFDQGYQPWLLDGVTGSGKTEVFLALARQVLARGKTVLILVPEIGLVPQMVDRAQRQVDGQIVVLHSELAEGERLLAHRAVADGQADIVVGTRSALWAPLPKLGLIVVDEEHDAAYKQQEGVRYHARDMALVRASKLSIPVVLGSATPSFESLANCQRGRIKSVALSVRVGGAPEPRWWVEDLSQAPHKSVIGKQAVQLISEHLARDQQVLVFRNRRGFAPVLICRDCGWQAQCTECDARMVIHRAEGRLRCHHCGKQQQTPASCPECAGLALHPLGVGTERVEDALAKEFPQNTIVRFDRDTVARKGARESGLAALREGGAAIIVGTQMLAKGHDLPRLSLVVVCQLDEALHGVDFRSTERLGQLLIQVAGRAGRRDAQGLVVLETAHPEHLVLKQLLMEGYSSFARTALEERRMARMPPYAHSALLRADAPQRSRLDEFLQVAADKARTELVAGLEVFGPLTPPMARRANRERGQILLMSDRRDTLHTLLQSWLEKLRRLRGSVHWTLDVDPLDWY